MMVLGLWSRTLMLSLSEVLDSDRPCTHTSAHTGSLSLGPPLFLTSSPESYPVTLVLSPVPKG